FDKIKPKPVEAGVLDQPARIFHQRLKNVGIAMAQVRHVSEAFEAFHGLVAAGMKACPVAREPAALRRKACPATLTINGIYFLRVTAGIVVENHISNDLGSGGSPTSLKIGNLTAQRSWDAIAWLDGKLLLRSGNASVSQ